MKLGLATIRHREVRFTRSQLLSGLRGFVIKCATVHMDHLSRDPADLFRTEETQLRS
jgi:hypothetical protein